MGCQKFLHGGGLVEGCGTLRRLPKALSCLVGLFKGGPQRPKWPKMAKMTTCQKKIIKSLIFLIGNVIYGLDRLRGCGGTKLGHS